MITRDVGNHAPGVVRGKQSLDTPDRNTRSAGESSETGTLIGYTLIELRV